MSWNTSPISALLLSLVKQKGHRLWRGPTQTCLPIPASTCMSHVLWGTCIISLVLGFSLTYLLPSSFLPSFFLSFFSLFLPPSLPAFIFSWNKHLLHIKHCPKYFTKLSHLILRTTCEADTIFIILIYKLENWGTGCKQLSCVHIASKRLSKEGFRSR